MGECRAVPEWVDPILQHPDRFYKRNHWMSEHGHKMNFDDASAVIKAIQSYHRLTCMLFIHVSSFGSQHAELFGLFWGIPMSLFIGTTMCIQCTYHFLAVSSFNTLCCTKIMMGVKRKTSPSVFSLLFNMSLRGWGERAVPRLVFTLRCSTPPSHALPTLLRKFRTYITYVPTMACFSSSHFFLASLKQEKKEEETHEYTNKKS